MVTQELIERFFRNDCTPEEEEQVRAFFKANPNDFARFLDEREWEAFESGEKMDPELSKKLFENVRRQTVEKTGRTKIIRRLAIAASVVLIAGLGWMYLGSSKHDEAVAKAEDKKKDSLTFVARHEVNYTGKEKEVKLEDGSVVTLSNNSEITYQVPFIDKRDITLIGKAFFKVAKDKTKPFTVISGEVTTTALGTQFTVSSYRGESNLSVRLYEGKVVIKPVRAANRLMKEHVYLLPGQEFIYDGQSMAKVRAFGAKVEDNDELASDDHSRDRPVISEKISESYFMFNNQSLARVLKDLSALYNTKLVYNKQDVEKIYFTGKYDKSESLKTILKRIATLNGLTITEKDSAFILTK